jgi:hypothetical protein
MNTNDNNSEGAGQAASSANTTDLTSKAWAYLRKLFEKKEQELLSERKFLLNTLDMVRKSNAQFAIEVGNLLFSINKFSNQGQLQEMNSRIGQIQQILSDVANRLSVKIVDPTGEEITDELSDCISVLTTISKSDIQGHIVGETLSPIILYQKKVIKAGVVVGWYGEKDD